MNRQKLILALLLVAFAGSLVYSFVRSPKQQRVATLKYRPGAVATAPRRGGAAAPAAPAQEVHLALLDREQARATGFSRNIFSPIFHEEQKLPPFKPLPPPKPARPLPPPPPPLQGQLPAGQPAQPPPPTPEEIAQQELGRFIFLGFLKKNGEKTVFLSKDNEIYLARKGSKLANNFVVSDLTDDALTIRSVATGKELVIPLLENRSLTTRRTSRRSTP